MRVKLQEILNAGRQTDLDVGYVMMQILPVFFASEFLLVATQRMLTHLRLGHLTVFNHGTCGLN